MVFPVSVNPSPRIVTTSPRRIVCGVIEIIIGKETVGNENDGCVELDNGAACKSDDVIFGIEVPASCLYFF